MRLQEEFLSTYTCAAPDDLPPQIRSRLTFHSCLRKREHQEVYLVADIRSGERQVLKIAAEGGPNNLRREYELLAKLNHPGIPTVILFEQDEDGREYLLRTYAEGDTLKNLVERDGAFPKQQTLEIAHKLCEVLSYLHQQSPPVIYRDITPGNIVVTPNGKLSLIDFGISREDTSDKGFDTVYVGSAAFASPEQFGFSKTDSRSDIFALGKLMIYLTTGEAGLQDYNENSEPGAFKKIVTKCTQLSPEKRYASVTQLSRAITRQLNPPTRREYLIAAVCAILVVAVGFAVDLHFAQSLSEAGRSPVPISAAGDEYADEVKIPVQIEVLYDGVSYADCAVAVDNHHWYRPDVRGRAELLVFAYDNYIVRAAAGNRTLKQSASITREALELSYSLDIALTPEALESMWLELPSDSSHEIPLDVSAVSDVTLSGQPAGVEILLRNGKYYLVVDDTQQPGHYTLYAEWSNEHGTADTVISLNLVKAQDIVYIRTPNDLNSMRENLSAHYMLENDIDLSDYGEWTPVGTSAHPFTGIFDGNGYSIHGLTIYEYQGNAGLFGHCRQAKLCNIILQNPDINVPGSNGWGIAALTGFMEMGLIENCAVIDGTITTDTKYYCALGSICGQNSGIIKGCYSSAEILLTDIGRNGHDSYAGGICGENFGYIIECGNTGSVAGPVLAGGITASCDGGIVAYCYNAGLVRAPDYWGEIMPGGIAQMLGRGKRIAYCAFEVGSAPVGATVWNGGTLLNICPLEADEFQTLDKLENVFYGQDAAEQWEYIASISDYPIPKGIFTR